jgi:hypothetical protein
MQFEKDFFEMDRFYLADKGYSSGYKDFPTAPRPQFRHATPLQPAVKLSGNCLFSAGSLKTL